MEGLDVCFPSDDSHTTSSSFTEQFYRIARVVQLMRGPLCIVIIQRGELVEAALDLLQLSSNSVVSPGAGDLSPVS
jgi:hypothetical protein